MAVTKIEFTKKPFAEGRSFGQAGPYELLEGKVSFALDPTNRLNQVITDLEMAPRGEGGLVRCSADFCLLRPKEAGRRNRRLLLDVLNRGNKVALGQFDLEPAPRPASGELVVGEGWLLRQGYTIAWCGWQHDVPEGVGRMQIETLEAREGGRPVTGKVLCQFQVNAPTQVIMLSHGGHRPYPVRDLDEWGAVLQVREYPDAPAQRVLRERWRFARLEEGREVPDARHIFYPEGFEAGKCYEVVYTAVGAPLTGVGLAATRDVASFLRYGSVARGNPCAGDIDFVLAFGASQSGAFLRQMLYLGLCEDEEGRLALDGLLAHIAGSWSTEVNWRFGQPSYHGPRTPGFMFPYTDGLQQDPSTGEVDGLQRRAQERGKAPKVMYTNTSAEYWYLNAALCHVAPDGSGDVPLPDNVRMYHFAGAPHGRGTLPLTDTNALTGTRSVYPMNSLDYTPLLRAALVNLDRWVSGQGEAPPSRHPRLADGTLVERESLRERMGRSPGVRLPQHLPSVGRLDYGPEMGSWRLTQVPPKMDRTYPALVPNVDTDGNELGGIRYPEVAVPLATYTGWNLRHPEIGAADQLLPLVGITLPFPRDPVQRRQTRDPRPSIQERYGSMEVYLDRLRAAAQELVRQRYLLQEDVEPISRVAKRRYELFVE